MVGQAIEQSGGQLLVAEDLDPFAESQIGGDDSSASLIALGEQVEEQLATSTLERHEAQLVYNQQRDLLVALLQVSECAFVTCLDEVLHQVSGAGEKHPITPARGFYAQRNCEHRFAGADGTGDDYRLGAYDELATRQLENLGFRHPP